MSIQDDFFDVDAKLEGTPEAESFDRIWTQMCRLEAFQEEIVKWLSDIERGAFRKHQIERGDWRDLLK